MVLKVSPKRFLHKVRILGKFVSVQLLVQALGFASGILLVRTLDKQQYAYLTIASTMQSAMHVLTDSGIGGGITFIGGKVWQSHYLFGRLINTAVYLRRHIALIVTVLIAPILSWILVSNHASAIYSALVTSLVLLSLSFQINIGIFSVVLQLHSQINQIQVLDLIFSFSRLLLLYIALSMSFLNAAVAILATSIAAGVQSSLLQRWANKSIDVNAPIDKGDQKIIVDLYKKQIPLGIFYCFQGQITILLISLLGSTENIAEVGALGRLGAIFAVISAVMTNVLIPSFSRCQTIEIMYHRYWQIIGALFLFGISLIGITALFPDKMLWVLGAKYSYLKNEVLLIVVSAVVNSIVGTMWHLNAYKAWVKHCWLQIPITILMQTVLLFFLNVSTINGVIIFGILSLIPNFFLNIYMGYVGFSALKTQSVVH
ncbi:polysaccharide biosynthesis protein [Trichocoleus sp. FACHB-591]|uniref:polysaccharide biosynthesis protein n=1 Tax=Trichocoleus sp. FACHB-591 TaxID=2692872 RepID=UPI0016888805|nr:polysaccharide biosynthesis protein [Trichocoleus sp. FACHB-591]MBD2093926.1 polysaccharide biosynthesis protein [Trichocoleus sp. FACHB-591]